MNDELAQQLMNYSETDTGQPNKNLELEINGQKLSFKDLNDLQSNLNLALNQVSTEVASLKNVKSELEQKITANGSF